MAVDPTAAQSDAVSNLRTGLKSVLDTLYTLDQHRLKAAALGGVDAFVSGAFAGSNVDIDAAALDAAVASALKLRATLIDGTGNPTADMLAIARVAK